MSTPDTPARAAPSEPATKARAHIYASARPQDSHQAILIDDLVPWAVSGCGEELVLAARRGLVSKKEHGEIQPILEGEAGRKE